MRLPGASRAYIAHAKVRDYLLSPTHPDGQTKARFFARVGFVQAAWPRLLRELESLAVSGDAEPGAPTSFGQKYVIRGTITSRAGRTASLVTVWMVRSGEDFPRFITAYPKRGVE